jgi:hypothetical protein
MLVFSFSKLTIEHTKTCSKEFSDANLFTDDKKIMTIDSFCYKVLEKLDTDAERCNVNVLTAKMHSLLEDDRLRKYLRRSKYKSVKCIFIDEAQDLN